MSALRAPPPPRVLVLTTLLDSGGVAAALRMLGHRPYTFADVYKYGHIQQHPREWLAILDGAKPFDTTLLRGNPYICNCAARDARDGDTATMCASVWRARSATPPPCCTCCYDVLVGPPAATAFPTVLRGCSPDTRVILVETVDKAAAVRDSFALAQQLLTAAEQLRYVVGDALRSLIARTSDLSYTIRTCSGTTVKHDTMADVLALAPGDAVALLQQYEELVRAIVPAEQLLVYRPDDGWAPLLHFLRHSSTAPASALSTMGAAHALCGRIDATRGSALRDCTGVATASSPPQRASVCGAGSDSDVFTNAIAAATLCASALPPWPVHDHVACEVDKLVERARGVRVVLRVFWCVLIVLSVGVFALTYWSCAPVFVRVQRSVSEELQSVSARVIEDGQVDETRRPPSAHEMLTLIKHLLVRELRREAGMTPTP